MKLRHYIVVGALLLACYLGILLPFVDSMGRKSYAEKLGLIPHPMALKVMFADYKELVGASILGKVFLYFGSVLEKTEDMRNLTREADYPGMSRAVHAALLLDPYNMDGYYFGQSILAWDARQYLLANELLEYGMKYRTWDWQLPFFVGFNRAFFLKDYRGAAQMYMRAGDLSGVPLFKNLAGRYLQETGRTQMAIDYLSLQVKSASDPAIRKVFQTRLDAFNAVKVIEDARDRFNKAKGRNPSSVEELLSGGWLKVLPKDPYGGDFYFDSTNNVASTSKFAFAPHPSEKSGVNPHSQSSKSE